MELPERFVLFLKEEKKMYKQLIVSALLAGGASGQSVYVSNAVGPVGITTALAGKIETVTAAPYSAQSVTERIQVLADGNRIVQTTAGSVARDGQGRMRREEALPGFAGANGDTPHIVMIDDPVAQVHWTLDAQSKTATKMPGGGMVLKQAAEARVTAAGPGLGIPPLPPPPGAARTFFTTVDGGKMAVYRKDTAEASAGTKTDLGKQIVEGVLAQGTQFKFTIPAGQVGNEQPIVISTETWYSPELKVTVMSKSSDPRMGDTVYKLTNIQRSEPPVTLFQVPDDYTIKDQPAMHLDFHAASND
jgi:hypothetical protein